jgi:hypothetical protein
VTGLKGLTYLDKSKDPKNPAKQTEQRDAVTFGQGLVDSVYLAAPEHVELEVGTGESCDGGAALLCVLAAVTNGMPLSSWCCVYWQHQSTWSWRSAQVRGLHMLPGVVSMVCTCRLCIDLHVLAGL